MVSNLNFLAKYNYLVAWEVISEIVLNHDLISHLHSIKCNIKVTVWKNMHDVVKVWILILYVI
jgi:hypothetical protein